jgi:hypothetical protein
MAEFDDVVEDEPEVELPVPAKSDSSAAEPWLSPLATSNCASELPEPLLLEVSAKSDSGSLDDELLVLDPSKAASELPPIPCVVESDNSESGLLDEELLLPDARSCETGLLAVVAALKAASTCPSTAVVDESLVVLPVVLGEVLLNVLGSMPLVFSTPTSAL